MPKEVIKGVGGMYDINVGWSEETVQIGISTTDRESILFNLGEYQEADSLWSTLDVDSLDSLILILNRARVKAYG